MSTKKKMSDELANLLRCALDRQISGVQNSTKLASQATCGDEWEEVLMWLRNAQGCLSQAQIIANELKGGEE